VQALCQAMAKQLPPPELGGEAVHCALQAIQVATTSGTNLEDSLLIEEEMIMNCLVSPQGMAHQRHSQN
jgi:hypothetical protein